MTLISQSQLCSYSAISSHLNTIMVIYDTWTTQINTMYHHNLSSNWISFLFSIFPACKRWKKVKKMSSSIKPTIMTNHSFYTRLWKMVKMKDSAEQQKVREKRRGVTSTHLYRISCRGNVHAVMQSLAAFAGHGRNCDTNRKLWAAFNSLYTPCPNIYRTDCLKNTAD